ncbi:unnamed protein product, partial [Prorocentrum cordatum]
VQLRGLAGRALAWQKVPIKGFKIQQKDEAYVWGDTSGWAAYRGRHLGCRVQKVPLEVAWAQTLARRVPPEGQRWLSLRRLVHQHTQAVERQDLTLARRLAEQAGPLAAALQSAGEESLQGISIPELLEQAPRLAGALGRECDRRVKAAAAEARRAWSAFAQEAVAGSGRAAHRVSR